MAQKLRQDLNIGAIIRDMRQACNMTQPQVVRELQLMGCSISRSTYSRIEMGKYNIRLGELIALKLIFKAAYSDFFGALEEQFIETIETKE